MLVVDVTYGIKNNICALLEGDLFKNSPTELKCRFTWPREDMLELDALLGFSGEKTLRSPRWWCIIVILD